MSPDALIELLAVATGIASVALTVRQHIANWPVGILSSGLFMVLFVEAGLYADSMLQVLYVLLGVYGWWHWRHGAPGGQELPVTSASTRVRIACAIGAIVGTLAFGAFLDGSTDSTVPYPDAATTVLSITAQILLTRKLIETWPVWIFGVNIPFIAIYLYKGLALTAGLQLVFIALSIAGWVAWHRSMTLRSASAIDAAGVDARVVTA